MLKPPQTHDVFPKCEGLLEASQYASDFGQVDSVQGDFNDIEEPNPNTADGSWRRVVLMQVTNGLAEQKEFLDKVKGFRFRVRCDFMPPEVPDSVDLNVKAFLEGLHQKVYEVLNRQTLTLDKADQVYQIVRTIAPGKMFREPDKGFRYMTAEFVTVLGPTS